MRCRPISRGHRQTGNPQVTASFPEIPFKPWKHTRPALARLQTLCKVNQDLVVGVADNDGCRRCLHGQFRQRPVHKKVFSVQLTDGMKAVQSSCAFRARTTDDAIQAYIDR